MIAPAKLNLFLHVAPPRQDGMHELFSLAAFTEFGDEIAISNASRMELSFAGPFADELSTEPEENLAWRAAFLLKAWSVEKSLGENNAAMRLTKNLPIASGIGGGSTDAAATLLELVSHWNLPIDSDELHQIAASLGADVPVCLYQKPAWMTGIGDKVEFGPKIPALPVVIVNPLTPVSTPQVYSKFDAMGAAGSSLVSDNLPAKFATPNALFDFLGSHKNDLEAPAIDVEPAIEIVLDELRRTNAAIARMSGSGATCFGLFENQQSAEQAAAAISRNHSNWWIKQTSLLSWQG